MNESASINDLYNRVSNLSPAKRALLGLRLNSMEAAPAASKRAQSAKRLVAYVVLNDGPPPQSNQLRSFLLSKLPDYMVPSAYVYMEGLPMTPSGKLDRRALPPPSQTLADMEADFVAPRSPVEEVLCAIWADALGLERISVHSDFFEMGGHSLTAAQVVYKIRDILQIELPVRSLFEATTVAKLSEALIAAESKPGRAQKVAEIYRRIRNMSSAEMKEEILKRKRA